MDQHAAKVVKQIVSALKKARSGELSLSQLEASLDVHVHALDSTFPKQLKEELRSLVAKVHKTQTSYLDEPDEDFHVNRVFSEMISALGALPRTRVIDGRSVTSLEQFFERISYELEFPEWFGENLDALWDCLVNEVEGPLEVIWENSIVSEKAIGAKFSRLRELLLEELPKEREDIRFVFK